jgi:hypothetical protein
MGARERTGTFECQVSEAPGPCAFRRGAVGSYGRLGYRSLTDQREAAAPYPDRHPDSGTPPQVTARMAAAVQTRKLKAAVARARVRGYVALANHDLLTLAQSS